MASLQDVTFLLCILLLCTILYFVSYFSVTLFCFVFLLTMPNKEQTNKMDEEIHELKFLKAMRLQSKIRKMELNHKEKRSQIHAHEAFNKNSHQYVNKLLDNKTAQGKPSFSTGVANEFFYATYEDKIRDYYYNSLRCIPKPAAPRKQMSENPPSLAELRR